LHAVYAAASATKAKPEDVERAEAELPIDDMVRQAVESAALERFAFPDIR